MASKYRGLISKNKFPSLMIFISSLLLLMMASQAWCESGGGGAYFKTQTISTQNFKDAFVANGFSQPSSQMNTFGGRGFGSPDSQWRKGGGGAVSTLVERLGESKATVVISYGGFILERIYDMGIGVFSVGSLLGGGTSVLKVNEADYVETNWVIEPRASFEFKISPWMNLGIVASYLSTGVIQKIRSGNELSNSELKLSGFAVGLEFLFGVF